MKYNEVTYELLARQYEIAKIDEAKDSAIIQVMDKAIEPDRKSRPRRSLIVLLSVLVTFLLAIVWAFALEAVAKSSQDPLGADRWQVLKQHVALRAWWRNRDA